MPTVSIDEAKLEELIEKTVQNHLKMTFEDMEEVRRSPAGAIIRIEEPFDGLDRRIDGLERRLERDMVTRAEFKHEFRKLRLYFVLLAVLIVLTNPKVLELVGKILGIIK